MSQATLAERAELARTTVERIEVGTRRTRRSTLERIARALGSPDACEELAALAGPALAPESSHPDRIERRRSRRTRREERRREAAELAREWERLLSQRDFSAQPGLDRKLVDELATLRFVSEHSNVLLIGPPGVGKTMLAVALAHRVVVVGRLSVGAD